MFFDYNNDGAADGPDFGIKNVQVTILGTDAANNPVAPVTVLTDAQGNFSFQGIRGGTYSVRETAPAAPHVNGITTPGTAGGTVTANAPAGVTVSGVTFPRVADATGYLFAEIPVVDPAGVAFVDTNRNNRFDFIDANANGLYDDGETALEPAIPNTPVTLQGTDVVGNVVNFTKPTDAFGRYSFATRDAAGDPLLPGVYSLTEGAVPGGFPNGPMQNGIPAATISGRTFGGIDLTAAPFGGDYNFGHLPAVDLRLAASVSNPTPHVGDIVGITFTVSNLGPSADAGILAAVGRCRRACRS